MATETVAVRLDETWKPLSLDNSGPFSADVVGFRDALFFVGDSIPANGTYTGLRQRSIPPTTFGTAKVYARAVEGTTRVNVSRTVNAGNASTPVFQALGLSASALSTAAQPGTVIGTLTNRLSGSTTRLLTNTNTFALSSDGSTLVAGLIPAEPGKKFVTVRESHPDAGSNDTTLEVTVSAPALSISGANATATEGQDFNWTPAVSGGYGRRSFRLIGSLPTGWSMSSTTGAVYAPGGFISASMPAVSGFSIAVRDEAGNRAQLDGITFTPGAGGGGNPGEVDVFIIGSQSNMLAAGSSADLNGGVQYLPSGYTTPDPLLKIWNDNAAGFVTYEPYVNSSGDSGSTHWGPEWAFFLQWKAANPGKTMYLVKNAVGNTGLGQDPNENDWNVASSGELYTALKGKVNRAKAALIAAGKTPVVQMMFSRIGEQDAKDSAKSAAYQANFQQFIAQSRTDFGYTRHCVVRLHLEQFNQGFPYWLQVRSAMKAVADADANVEVVNTDGAGFVDNTLHVDRVAIEKMGRDMWWVYSRGWTQQPYVGLTQIAEVARGRFAYPFVPGDISTMKSGTIENVLNCSTTATTTRTYLDSSGARRNGLAANTLRQTFAGGRQQLVSEGTALNRAASPRDFTNAAWVASGVTVAKDRAARDRTANSACTITATAANGTLLQAITDATSRARSFTVDVQRGAGTGAVAMTMDGGATWQDITAQLAAGWGKATIPTQTLANPSIGFRLSVSGDSVGVDIAMLEDTPFFTSPIPAASTRNPENITFVENAALQGATGTFAIKAANSRNTGAVFASGDTGRIAGRNANANQITVGLASGATFPVTAGSGGVTGDFGAAVTFDGTDVRASLNGGAVTSDAGPISAHTTGLKIGMVGTNAASQIAGFIDALYAGPTKIPDAQLQALATAYAA